jgi:hypothetical protein
MAKYIRKARKISIGSKPHTLARIDGRSREAELMKRVVSDLIRHIGEPNTIQMMLINRAAVLTLRLGQIDQKIFNGGDFSVHDTDHAIAWQNALTRCLVALGVQKKAAQQRAATPVRLSTYLNADRAA